MKKARGQNLDGLIITDLDQVRYLCGYTGSNGLLVIRGSKADFLTDFRYADQCKQEVKGAGPHVMKKGDLIAGLGEFDEFKKKNIRFGYSAGTLPVGALERLRKSLPDALLVGADEVLSDLGWVKEKQEINLIAKAAEIGDTALERVLGLVRPGVPEREIAAELEYQMVMLGAEKRAFETIVASGYRSALPHGAASDKEIEKGDFVTFDFGATYRGYSSDMTRTVVVGKATSKQKKIYNTVLRAQKAALRKVKAGVAAADVDKAARNIIKKAGYEKEFGHGTGHGIGFPQDPIHTGPRVSPISEDTLKVNQVITVEPGIYLSGWGGVRIEDDVVVGRNGGRILNTVTKKLLEL
jgi:Xaa-Pro aminopeptidase